MPIKQSKRDQWPPFTQQLFNCIATVVKIDVKIQFGPVASSLAVVALLSTSAVGFLGFRQPNPYGNSPQQPLMPPTTPPSPAKVFSATAMTNTKGVDAYIELFGAMDTSRQGKDVYELKQLADEDMRGTVKLLDTGKRKEALCRLLSAVATYTYVCLNVRDSEEPGLIVSSLVGRGDTVAYIEREFTTAERAQIVPAPRERLLRLAADDYERAQRYDAQSSRLWRDRGILHAKLLNLDAALTCLRRADRLRSDVLTKWQLASVLASLYENSHDEAHLDEATSRFRGLIKNNQENESCSSWRGELTKLEQKSRLVKLERKRRCDKRRKRPST